MPIVERKVVIEVPQSLLDLLNESSDEVRGLYGGYAGAVEVRDGADGPTCGVLAFFPHLDLKMLSDSS
jgi:hypothetical protein